MPIPWPKPAPLITWTVAAWAAVALRQRTAAVSGGRRRMASSTIARGQGSGPSRRAARHRITVLLGRRDFRRRRDVEGLDDGDPGAGRGGGTRAAGDVRRRRDALAALRRAR